MSAVIARPATRAFTLVELLVATAVLVLILMLTLSVTDATSRLTTRTRARVETFQEARAGFEALTRTLSQAMLNTYWDYEPSLTSGAIPQRYVRQSELHFIAGRAEDLLGSQAGDVRTHAVFFQAPLGFGSRNAGNAAGAPPLDDLLNVCGYYTVFGSNAAFRPPYLSAAGMPDRYRFRLMEAIQPSEKLAVYDGFEAFQAGGNTAVLRMWFTGLFSTPNPPVHPLAENVVALVLEPMRSPHETPPAGSPAVLAPEYFYSTRAYLTGTGSPELQKISRNQLPPVVKVTMVAISETSAVRLANGSTPPVVPVANGRSFDDLFRTQADYARDLADLEKGLADARIDYRIFTSGVSIEQAKWSEDK